MPMWFLQPSHQMLYGISNLQTESGLFAPVHSGSPWSPFHNASCSHIAKGMRVGRIKDSGHSYSQARPAMLLSHQLTSSCRGEEVRVTMACCCLSCLAKKLNAPRRSSLGLKRLCMPALMLFWSLDMDM